MSPCRYKNTLKHEARQVDCAFYRGLPSGQPYSATKAALSNLAESLWLEQKHNNIDIKIINPGFVRTPMTDQNRFKMPALIPPETAAKAIAKGGPYSAANSNSTSPNASPSP